MTDIMVPATPVTGLMAKIVRDNVANPDTELGARALTQIMAPYKQQTLSRAQQAYRTAYAENPDDATLPNMLNDAAVIEWYLARPDYKDATVRENEQKAIQVNAEITSLTSQRTAHENKLATATESEVAGIQNIIDALDARIAALSA